MLKLLRRSRFILLRTRCTCIQRTPYLLSSSSVVLKTDVDATEGTEKPRLFRSDIDRIGLRRYLDVHKSSSLLLTAKRRAESFDALWLKIIKSDPAPEIDLVNKYLYCVMDCGMSFDPTKILNDLKEIGVTPNIRTFGAFIRQSCSRGNMEQTSLHLQLLQEANMVPDLNIFSQILYGYLKAGSPEEVTSTQDIMKQLGLWPSRQGYEGILTAYAELGDRASLLETLNEAYDVLAERAKFNEKSRLNLPFSNMFLIQLYVKLLCAEPDANGVCTEILSRLPVVLDQVGRAQARDGVKHLLAHRRVEAAEELFKRADPESSDDPYLSSLARYANAGGLDADVVQRFWRLADVFGSRLNVLERNSATGPRRGNMKISELYVLLQEAIAKKDTDAIFEAINTHGVKGSATVYNHAVPTLMKFGVKPKEILERIQEPESLRSAGALGCIIGTIAPLPNEDGSVPEVDFSAAEALANEFKEQKLFPYDGFVYISPFMCRHFLKSSSSAEQLASKLTILSNALSLIQLKAVVTQLFEVALESPRSRTGSPRLSPEGMKSLQMLVDACVLKGIKFSRNYWIFYTLENAGIPPKKCEQLKISERKLESANGFDSQSSSVNRNIRHAIQVGDIDRAISLIKPTDRFAPISDNTQMHSRTSSVHVDPVLVGYDLLKGRQTDSEGTVAGKITAADLERLFWASWEAQILVNPLRAISLVALAYSQTKDLNGMAGYFDRASKQFGDMQATLLTPNNMKTLLDHNFEDNLVLLKRMVTNAFLPTATMANAACLLEDLVQHSGKKIPEPETWKRGSPEYWPVQVLSKRLQAVNHLQKLRTIHNAIEELCKANYLFAAHSLRLWSTQIGLLLFPKTNELLILTPYFNISSGRVSPLHKWALSHDLCQHFPVPLTTRQLRALDELITPESRERDDSAQMAPATVVQKTASWLVENISAHSSTSAEAVDFNTTNYLPTWLVVSQNLHQVGSYFVHPQSLYPLAGEWLQHISTAAVDSATWFKDLSNWIRFAPSVEHKCALIMASLLNPKSQDWTWKNYLENGDLFYSFAMSEVLDAMSQDELTSLSHVLSRYDKRKSAIFELARAFLVEPLDSSKITRVSAAIPVEQLCHELSSIVCARNTLMDEVFQWLHESHRDFLPTFVDDLWTKLRTQPRCLRFVRSVFLKAKEAGIDTDKFSAENQAFLFAAFRMLNVTQSELPSPLKLFGTVLDPSSNESWSTEVPAAISREDFVSLLEMVQKLDASKRAAAVTLLTYAMPSVGEISRLNKFVMAVAEQMDGQLLETAALCSRPFISYSLGEAYSALARLYNDRKLDWFDRACIRYHKLGPLMQMKGASVTPRRQSTRYGNHTGDLAALLRQPVSSLAEALVKAQADPKQLDEQLAHVTSSWSIQRRNALLAYLTAEGASSVVDRVIALTPEPHREKQTPFRAFSAMIHANASQNANPDEVSKVIRSALDSLSEIPSTDVASCLKGPHVESLFRCWPNEKLTDLITLVRTASPTERSSINLQLTSILINRGRRDLADQLIKVTGPLPVTFLAGSPRHTLSPNDFKATLDYLQEADPDHVPAFIDTCLRNAASTTDSSYEKLANLVRTMVDQPHSINLSQICLLPTLNLLAEFVRRHPKLPADVKKTLDFAIESKTPRTQSAST